MKDKKTGYQHGMTEGLYDLYYRIHAPDSQQLRNRVAYLTLQVKHVSANADTLEDRITKLENIIKKLEKDKK